MDSPKSRGQRKAAKTANPLVNGIQRLVKTNGAAAHSASDVGLQSTDIPKRYTIYEPMLLLNSNFATYSSTWHKFYSALSSTDLENLFSSILDAFHDAGVNVTHIALNAPIQLDIRNDDGRNQGYNITRSPVNLRPLHGDFGPDELLQAHSEQPTKADFEAAFWVEAAQLSGILQLWAPRWTMFSRGNIREKARILGLAQHNPSPFPGLSEEHLGQSLHQVDVIDFYVGIGYFALPYLRRGVRRVFGWEINGWSVEGLRRGCEKNGFECEVFLVPDQLDNTTVSRLAQDVARAVCCKAGLRCVVFRGDNRHAPMTMKAVDKALALSSSALNVRHCNMGLLPSSRSSYEGAVRVVSALNGAWLHIHENADILSVEQKRLEVKEQLKALLQRVRGDRWQLWCEQTEMVKTYAPGVGHFVFDIKIWPA